MKPRTHLETNPTLCGRIVDLSDGKATVALDTTNTMSVDAQGLVHGGFVFGLADYAAMLAVNDPHVVLGSAEVRFLRPASVGDQVVARAEVKSRSGRKHEVGVEAQVGSRAIFEGVFVCFVLDRHVLTETEDEA